MIRQIINQYKDELSSLVTAESDLNTLLCNLQMHFQQDFYSNNTTSSVCVGSSSRVEIEGVEENYNLLSNVKNLKEKVNGSICRLKQAGSRATLLRNEYEKLSSKLMCDSVTAYKLTYVIASNKCPHILEVCGEAVRSSITKINDSISEVVTSITCNKDDQNNIKYMYKIKNTSQCEMNGLEVTLSITIDKFGNCSDIVTCMKNDGDYDIVNDEANGKFIQSMVMAAKGKINIIDVDKTVLRQYSPKISENKIILTIRDIGMINKDEAGRPLNVKPELYKDLVKKIIKSTGTTKDKIKYFTKLFDDKIEVHFKIEQ